MDVLLEFGAPSESCVDLHDEQDVRRLRYTDLVRNRQTPLVDYVVEQQAQALLYVVDQARLRHDDVPITRLQRTLAMRGEPAWLGVLKPGRLDIYATDLQPAAAVEPVWFSRDSQEAPSILPRLAQGESLAPPATLRLRDALLDLMTDAGEALRGLGVSTHEAIALTGRALFLRYLIGRKIVLPDHLPKIAPSAASLDACMSNDATLAETNLWLDNTFNGDLLALPETDYAAYFRQLVQQHGQAVTQPLSAILTLDTAIEPGVSQRRLAWGDLDFDHLPIGLLSETYEELIHRFDKSARHATSVYYTPYHIAEYMAEEAFHGLPEGSEARLLDPACGAGVFLVAGLRKLVELRFRETGERPTREQIRGILHQQVVGFDTNGHARTLAALALYLTALELDPHPAPVEALRFKKLEGSALIDVADPGSQTGELVPMAGSLGDHVFDHYRDTFDVVIGNPPWTSLSVKYGAIDCIFTRRCREVAARRGLDKIAANYHNPDRVPDLPFVWGAMAWAKPGGRIALALAGRWLFKQSSKGVAARNALFEALKVTGILNGAALRQTQVWPSVDQPFCLLFADNVLPEPNDQFVFVSPHYEPDLNDKGLLRVDASDASPVAFSLVMSTPAALKTLYRGTVLDMAIVNKIKQRAKSTIGDYWKASSGLNKGRGFQVASRAQDDTFLDGKPELQADYDRHPFRVLNQTLDGYIPRGLHRTRAPEIYKAPLLLVREASRQDRGRGRALISDSDLAYSESFCGYSGAEHPQGDFLIRYLLVAIHSQLFEYAALMTSGKFGVEREAFQVLDIDRFPFIPPETLSNEQRQSIAICAQQLIDNEPDWPMLDRSVAQLYGLSLADQQVVSDTLAINAPYASARDRGLAHISKQQAQIFIDSLEKDLAAVFEVGGHSVRVQSLNSASEALPWRFFSISLDEAAPPPGLPEQWVNQAGGLGVSRITLLSADQSSLIVGLLNRYRYWTQSQARLLASELIWEFGARLEELSQQCED
ncbi:HsdM family class I SAM-dependent methyltransferase [Halomonas salipaludis]|uniref:site-specific DNA-methyltransferase (adenine-specific) n=1 Tax=Halomonas salipaludis TaxID=2032625 RepID=A0A2A2ESM5_9GAMM|nr:N-6 DNA methylase [Halomonas salipaludis]PAU75293.1 type I restriction endonuclease subunit M [Halomonas salipaludis]